MKNSAFDNFNEAAQDVLDFARCQRPDGSFYGTSGQCRKGSPTGAKEKTATRTRPKAAIESDMKKLSSSGAMAAKGTAGVRAREEHAALKAELKKPLAGARSSAKAESATATAKASKDPAVQKRLLQTEIKKVSAKYEKLRGKPEAAAERKKLMDRASEIVKKLGKIDAAASKAAGPKKPDTSLPAQQRRSSAAARAKD